MTTPSLFDTTAFEVPRFEPGEKLSKDRRRVQRQLEAIALAGHPLGLIYTDVRAHPDANGITATVHNAQSRPIRCGTCVFREPTGYQGRSFPKCSWRPEDDVPGPNGRHRTAPPRYSHGAGTDIRAWWPGCSDWQGKP